VTDDDPSDEGDAARSADGAPPAAGTAAVEGPERAAAGADDAGDAAPSALVVEDVARGFGAVTVLDGVSLAVARGSLAAVVGPNGSGKSTLLRIAAGVLAPDAGRVAVREGGVRPLGYLPQAPSFRPGFTAADTLRFYADLLGPEAAAAVDVRAALDRVGLGDAADRRVEALSGGMTRLLGLAQAMLGDPPVVVLDEPASGLDPAMSERVYATLRGLADDGRAVLVASHDLGAVERTADRVALLDRGGVVAAGAPEEFVAARGAADLVEAFLDAVGAAGAGSAGTVRTGARPGAHDAAGNEDAAGAETDRAGGGR
jgi:ABC-type multidrug transport system ATPase subunit